MLKTEELIERIGKVVGENESDEYLELLEYIRDNNETEDKEDWKSKYEENDKEWRKRYRERFFKKEVEDVEDEEDNRDDEVKKKYTYEDLFDESEE